MVNIINLYKKYSSKNGEVEVLRNINLLLPRRGLISLLGKSGSGKTTFLNLIGGLDSFNSGNIIFDGIDYSLLKDKDFDILRNNYISFVFQENNLVHDFTVKDNLLIAEENKSISLIDEKLQEFDLHDKIDKYPYELSGGEKQRVAIIRALIKKSKIILVDEPTGSLDKESSHKVLETLKRISKEKLVLMITHDIENAEIYSDYVYEIREKNIVPINSEAIEADSEITKKSDLLEQKSLQLTKKSLFSLGRNILKDKKIRVLQYIFVFCISFFMLGISYSTLFVNEYSVASSSFIDEGIIFYYLESSELDIYDIQDFDFLNDSYDCDIVYRGFSNTNIPDISLYLNDNYTPDFSGIRYFNNAVVVLEGDKPVNDNEILISDYLAFSYMKHDIIDGDSLDDLLYQSIPNTSLTIAGIYETDYSIYKYFLDDDIHYYQNNDVSDAIKVEFSYKKQNFYQLVYVNSNFDFSALNANINGEFTFEESYAIAADVLPITTHNLSEFSLEVDDENDIYISLRVLYDILSLDDSFSFDSYEMFLDEWYLNEEYITNYIIGSSINLGFSSESINYNELNGISYITHDIEVYSIKGIVEGVTQKNIFIYTEKYNMGFSSGFNLVIPVEDDASNISKLKELRENGFYYKSLSSDVIIDYIDENGKDLFITSSIISLVFILFSFVLYNTLISRDILNKTKLIGLFRSMGCNTKNIFGVFVYEVLIINTIAVIIALLLQPIGVYFFNIFLSQGAKITVLSFGVKSASLLVVSIILFSILALRIPYSKIKRISIARSINKEV